jgi:hypothetical protein
VVVIAERQEIFGRHLLLELEQGIVIVHLHRFLFEALRHVVALDFNGIFELPSVRGIEPYFLGIVAFREISDEHMVSRGEHKVGRDQGARSMFFSLFAEHLQKADGSMRLSLHPLLADLHQHIIEETALDDGGLLHVQLIYAGTIIDPISTTKSVSSN